MSKRKSTSPSAETRDADKRIRTDITDEVISQLKSTLADAIELTQLLLRNQSIHSAIAYFMWALVSAIAKTPIKEQFISSLSHDKALAIVDGMDDQCKEMMVQNLNGGGWEMFLHLQALSAKVQTVRGLSRSPPFGLSEMIKSRLIVYVIGLQGSPFSVQVESLDLVGELKKEIKQQKPKELSHIDPNRLTLYRVKLVTGVVDGNDLAKRAREALDTLKDEASKKKETLELDAAELLSEYFDDEYWQTAMKTKTVHVLVEMPHKDAASSKMLTSVDDPGATAAKRSREDEGPPAWLSGLHVALWNQPQLRDKFFREADITFSQFLELEHRLSDNNPLREEVDNDNDVKYRARHIPEIKLDFLRNPPTTAASPPPLDDDDPDDLRPLFPIKFSYCDLSSTLAAELIPDRCSFPILIREEYKCFSELLKSVAKETSGDERTGSCIVSGQPGIGKTTYLYLLLIERLLQGERTYFQTETGLVFLIGDFIEAVNPQSTIGFMNTGVVALVDADKAVSVPAGVLVSSKRVQVIATSSPKTKSARNWLNQLGAGMGITYAMKLWSLQEVLVLGMFFYPWDVPYHRIKLAIAHFGRNPRRCFDASKSSMRDRENQNLYDLINATHANDQISHTLFELDPKDERRFFTESRISAVSEWALDLVLKKFEQRRNDDCRKFFELARGSETMKPIVGTIWERQAHLFLKSLKKPKSFTIRRLSNGDVEPLDYPGNTAWAEFRLQTLGSILEKKVESLKNCYLKPVTTNFGAVDSLLYTSAELVLFQMTYAMDHDISVNGLKDIQHCLKVKGHLRPTVSHPWRFIFVVPEEHGNTFRFQKVKGVTPTSPWHKKVVQYVLALPYDDVWTLSGEI